jgi:hypothetical protein
MKKFFVFLVFCQLLVACHTKLGKFQEQVLRMEERNDSTKLVLASIDTNFLLNLRSKAKILFLKFNIQLGNDTLNLETAKEIDGLIQAYRATDYLTSDISKLRLAFAEQRKRLEVLKADIESGKGDRSQYFQFIKTEQESVDQTYQHAQLLANQYTEFSEAFVQFKPVFERFIAKSDTVQ